MPELDEINAWGNYETTGRNARVLTSRHGTKYDLGDPSLISNSEHGTQGSRSSIRNKNISLINKLNRSNHDHNNWQQVNEKKAVVESAIYSDFFSTKDVQSLQIRESSYLSGEQGEEEKSEGETRKKQQLKTTKVKESKDATTRKKYNFNLENASQLREIFGIYFEGCYSSNEKDNILAMGSKYYAKQRNIQKLCCFNNDNCLISFLRFINGTMPGSQRAIENYFGGSCDGDKSAFLSCLHLVASILLFVDYCLRGIGQVYFQNNPISGLFILVGLFLQSTRVAIHGILALVSGNLVAILLGFDTGLIRSGLFGYNALLVGLALATFDTKDEYTLTTMIATIIFGAFSSIIFVALGKLLVPYKSPPLTLPFNIATIMFLLATADMDRVSYHPVRDPSIPDYDVNDDGTSTTSTAQASDIVLGLVRGIGQVYLADNWISGLLIIVGIMVCSRISAIAAIYGSIIGSCVTFLVSGLSTAQPVYQGLYGFNASLTVTSMLMFYTPNIGSIFLGTLAGIMTVFCQQTLSTLLLPWGLPFMTLPFCLISLPFIILQGTTTLVFAIPLVNLTTPEDHLQKTRVLRDGFNLFWSTLRPLGKEWFAFSKTMTKHLEQLSLTLKPKTQALNLDSSYRSESMHINNKIGGSSSNISSICCQGRRNKRANSWIIKTACNLFPLLDIDKRGYIDLDQFCSALSNVGLNATEGMKFASLVFHLMDLEKSHTVGTMELYEFILFCEVSVKLRAIRNNIAKFVDFIDVNDDQQITFDKINAALEYLGQNDLSIQDRENLMNVGKKQNQPNKGKHLDQIEEGCYFDEYEGIDSIVLVNYMTVNKVKALVEVYHNNVNNLSITRHNMSILIPMEKTIGGTSSEPTTHDIKDHEMTEV